MHASKTSEEHKFLLCVNFKCWTLASNKSVEHKRWIQIVTSKFKLLNTSVEYNRCTQCIAPHGARVGTSSQHCFYDQVQHDRGCTRSTTNDEHRCGHADVEQKPQTQGHLNPKGENSPHLQGNIAPLLVGLGIFVPQRSCAPAQRNKKYARLSRSNTHLGANKGTT